MKGSVNKVILIGRLGSKDPEVKNLSNGQKVANFSICCQENFKDKSGQKKEITEWVNLVCWNGLADIAAKYLHKGDAVYIEGKLRTRSYDSAGTTKYITEVLAESLVLLGNSQERNTERVSDDFWNR